MNTTNRISELFNSNKKDLLSVYFCAGSPFLDKTADVIVSLERHGVNMIEIGLPFSDPMADGPVIQSAATKALRNGMSLKLLFSQLKEIRKTVKIPLIIMGYLNPIFQYGFENFCRSCNECGIDGCIIPDLPFDIYMKEFKSTAEKYNIKVIMLITPETEENRIRQIDENTSGFIYMVSSASTTGAQKDFNTAKRNYFKRIHDMHLKNSLMVGFGISNKSTFSAACEFARGGIIGSKFVSLLEEQQNPDRAIERLMEALK
jgi:tryptophan synthase alpha chain